MNPDQATCEASFAERRPFVGGELSSTVDAQTKSTTAAYGSLHDFTILKNLEKTLAAIYAKIKKHFY